MNRRILAMALAAAMLLSLLCVPALADGTDGPSAANTGEESIPEGNQAQGAWVYEVTQMSMGGPAADRAVPLPGTWAICPPAEIRSRTPSWRR